MILTLRLSFLFVFAYLQQIICTNNYYLEDKCVKNGSDDLITCDLVFHEDIVSSLNSEHLPGEGGIDYVKLVRRLKLEARALEGGAMHLKIFNAEQQRYEIPRNALEYFEKNKPFMKFRDHKNFEHLLSLRKGQKLSFTYKDDSGADNLFELFTKELIFLDDYIVFDYLFQTNEIFGYGERHSNFKLHQGVYTIWPRDEANSFDDGLGAKNSYGHQPFFLHKSASNNFIGVAFLNSNAQDLYIKYNKKNFNQGRKEFFNKFFDEEESNTDNDFPINTETSATQITIGGIIELVITTGKTPNETLQKYHHVLGKPTLPNFWALGWHQCRWGYNTTEKLQNVIDNYNLHKIPIDTIWSDIDYMTKYEDFSYDKIRYENLPEFIENINSLGIHYVPIIDIGIPYNKENYYFKLGKRLGAYIQSNYTDTHLLNDVWPGVCVFPDFTNYKKAKALWHFGLANLNYNLNFDGIWLDMNEPAGFTDGEIFANEDNTFKTLNFSLLQLSESEDTEALKDIQQRNQYSNLTYIPGLGRGGYTIEKKSLSLNAKVSKEFAPFNTVFNLKPLNVFYENKITNEYFLSINKRPFILSRSSFLGMGRYSNHWLGDNFSDFKNMTASIAGVFTFQMFGFNLVGADICGFISDTTDELCSRWTSLGAFYPFSRNHNLLEAKDQEPYVVGPKTLQAAKKAIKLKYSLLRYYYTQMYFSSLNGGVFFQPLFFQFPQVPEFSSNDKIANEQIMLGDALMFNPLLQASEENVSFAMPNANWNRFPGGETIYSFKSQYKSNQFDYIEFPGKFEDIHIFVRGGYIVPFYNILDNENALRSKDLEYTPLDLIINPDTDETASGSIIYDDVDSHPSKTLANKDYLLVKINYSGKSKQIEFLIENSYDKYNKRDAFISRIVIYRKKKSSGFYNSIFLSEKKVNFNKEIKFSIYYENNNMIIQFDRPYDIRTLGKFQF